MEPPVFRRIRSTFVEMPLAAQTSAAAIVLALLVGTTVLVHATGGTQHSYLHFMYVQVVLAGFAFGFPGGLVTGVLSGLLIGPFMPVDTDLHTHQTTVNWLFRTFFFVLIGSLVGAFAHALRSHLRELAWLREHHEETGLLNLVGLTKELNDRIAAAPETPLVISILQVNTFLEIQNTFGAGFGMGVLAHVIERAKEMVPEGSLVALVQPDRIATVVEAEAARRITRRRIQAAIQGSHVVDGVPLHVELSVGVARYPTHGSTAEELLQKASIAMHWANTSSSTISVYDVANDTTSAENLILLGAVHDAIDRGELEVWHQAKLHLATGEVAATEALVRWRHPEHGLVPPGRFMPQVEETMLVDAVTRAVIAGALHDAGAWRRAGHDLRVAVNLSVRNLRDRLLIDTLEQHTRANGLSPADIDLEITESAVMDDPEHCLRLISTLRDRGYGVAIDDFGVGQSSLVYLRKLRASCLKIDQDFVKTLATDSANQEIVRTILGLARALGLEVVAEGVEDEQALELLRSWGCDYGQGYLIGKPAPAGDIPALLAERRPPASPTRA